MMSGGWTSPWRGVPPSNGGAGPFDVAVTHPVGLPCCRQRELGRHDRRAAIALAIMQAVVIWRMSKEEVHPWQVLGAGAAAGLVLVWLRSCFLLAPVQAYEAFLCTACVKLGIMYPHARACLQVIYCTLLMSTVLTVAVVAGTEEFIHKRRVMLAVLRVATAASPMVAMHTRLVMQVTRTLHKQSWQRGEPSWTACCSR